ncbi:MULTISPECIES: hypothetical protein [Haloarcula]|uniref:hypothetical protein n=1 Tax=Haloarcula TaxID=2237 RepID=UPI00166EB295|nr:MULTISPECIES: hypothetical protein [Halomicroarcula]MBX0347625.1 hypothetical protein [Halomicroarcula pellucida]MDS0276441.1 hypothetical protein [Halomicroarcula sp. S1AR25-4]
MRLTESTPEASGLQSTYSTASNTFWVGFGKSKGWQSTVGRVGAVDTHREQGHPRP